MYPGGPGGQGISNGASGKNKSDDGECTTGGTAGFISLNTNTSLPDYSNCFFCGAGGYSFECDPRIEDTSSREFAGPGGQDGRGAFGKCDHFI